MAGGNGTRLHPLTKHVSKQLLPVFDKPMIYYPLSTLMLAGIREICVICSKRDLPATRELLGDGESWGIHITYAVQQEARGIAEAFQIALPILGRRPVCLVLGDNLFHGPKLGTSLRQFTDQPDAIIFAYEVADPSSYGVVELSEAGRPTAIEEKPPRPRSNLAVPGLYFFPADVYDIANKIIPGPRGELEISDVNQMYLSLGRLSVVELPRGSAWIDCGTTEDLHEASAYVRVLTKRQGLRIACPEEIAWRNGWISDDQLLALAEPLYASGYGAYLAGLLTR